MTMNDFCGLTPEEFGKIADAWHAGKQEQWEQVRTLAAFSIAPWNEKGKKIMDLMPFPWDNTEGSAPVTELTHEEKQRRFEEALEQRGLVKGC